MQCLALTEPGELIREPCTLANKRIRESSSKLLSLQYGKGRDHKDSHATQSCNPVRLGNEEVSSAKSIKGP